MKAIGFFQSLPIDAPEALVDLELPTPTPEAHDLLVRVKAIAVNPVDYKVRQSGAPAEGPRVLGWDVAGVVEAVGPEVTLFAPGDEVYYAGAIDRPGGNSEWHTVDERIVGHKPKTLDFGSAAALPLTTITAWEALFTRLHIARDGSEAGKSLLIIGGAGGVGSIAIQLAKQLAGLHVIVTASREASRDWCLNLGADVVLDHREPLEPQLSALGLALPEYILCTQDTDDYFEQLAALIAPQGTICSIVETDLKHDIELLKSKSAGFVWEFMFTRPLYRTADMIAQHTLLDEVAALVDAGRIRTTTGQVIGPIDAAHLRQAHALLEGRRVIGKLVLEGF